MGRKVVDRYLEDIQTALSLLQENPALLWDKSAFSTHFKFYRVREHFLVCIKLKDVLLVLTIKHRQMDLSSRIGELEPALVQEANLLHQRLVAAEKKTSQVVPQKVNTIARIGFGNGRVKGVGSRFSLFSLLKRP